MVRLRLALLSAALLILLFHPSVAADESQEPDPRFGLVSAFWLPEEAAALNVGWERILFYWSEIQPTGPDDWNTLHVMEEWLAEAQQQGREVVGLLKNTPTWATDGIPYGGVPRGLYLDHDDPENLWANYVRRIADYYGPHGVHRWIIWNEPDIDQGVYGTEWAGSVQDYYQLLKVAYLVLKERDPQAEVHLAGLTYWHDVVNGREQYLQRLLRVATADPQAEENDYFFDAISLHIYFRSETVADIVRQIDDIQQDFGLDKPIWINETNAAPTEDPDWPVSRPQFQLDLQQQSNYIVQAHALGFAAGAERIAIYKFFDVGLGAGEESFGLVRADSSIRPAYYALQTTIDLLQDFTEVTERREADHVQITFDQPRGQTDVLWARRALTVTVPITATLRQASLLDVMGQAVTIRPTNDVYSITLPAARCDGECLIGGAPYFLVQREPEPTPTPTATATARPSATPTITPTPTSSPTATAPASATPTATMPATPAPAAANDGGSAAAVSTAPSLPGWLPPVIGGLLALTLLWLALRRRTTGQDAT